MIGSIDHDTSNCAIHTRRPVAFDLRLIASRVSTAPAAAKTIESLKRDLTPPM